MPVRRSDAFVHARRRSLARVGAVLLTTVFFAESALSQTAISAMAQANPGPTILQASIQDGSTSLQLAPGGCLYLYGMTTGGAFPSTPFAAGQYAQATDVDGYLSAALAYGANAQNSFTTSTAYQVVGGASVAGPWKSFNAFYASNSISGAPSESLSFTVQEDSLVVVIGLASSQQGISLQGVPTLQIDALDSGPSASEAMIIAHAYLQAGAYTVTEQSSALAAGQDPNHMVDLIGVFVFGSAPATGAGSVCPSVNSGGVVNAAGFTAGAPVAPGSIASLFGSNLTSATNSSATSIEIGGQSAPLFYTSPGQINFQVPWQLASQSQATLTALSGGQASALQTVNLSAFAPGIFALTNGGGAIVDSQYKLISVSNPAHIGDTVVIYCTGLGPVSNQPPTGVLAPTSPLAKTLQTPQVTIGGVPASIMFSGLAPGFAGLYQVNAQISGGTPTGGAVPVQVTIAGVGSNTVTMAVQAGSLNPPTFNPPANGPAGSTNTLLITITPAPDTYLALNQSQVNNLLSGILTALNSYTTSTTTVSAPWIGAGVVQPPNWWSSFLGFSTPVSEVDTLLNVASGAEEVVSDFVELGFWGAIVPGLDLAGLCPSTGFQCSPTPLDILSDKLTGVYEAISAQQVQNLQSMASWNTGGNNFVQEPPAIVVAGQFGVAVISSPGQYLEIAIAGSTLPPGTTNVDLSSVFSGTSSTYACTPSGLSANNPSNLQLFPYPWNQTACADSTGQPAPTPQVSGYLIGPGGNQIGTVNLLASGPKN